MTSLLASSLQWSLRANFASGSLRKSKMANSSSARASVMLSGTRDPPEANGIGYGAGAFPYNVAVVATLDDPLPTWRAAGDEADVMWPDHDNAYGRCARLTPLRPIPREVVFGAAAVERSHVPATPSARATVCISPVAAKGVMVCAVMAVVGVVICVY